MKKEKQKTREFDNPKEALEYLKTKAKKGETIILDERATFSSPRKRSMFSKDKLVREEDCMPCKCPYCGLDLDEHDGDGFCPAGTEEFGGRR